jgi:adhesin transport system membrane fusion protein
VSSEEEAYRAQRRELSAQVAGAEQEIQQRQREIQEARARRDQAKQTLSLVRQELAVTRPLLRSGAVSEVEILRLEREEARLVGERDQAIAQILRVQSAYKQAERKVEQIRSQSNNQLQEQLTETLSELQSLNQSSAALEDRVDRAIIRSPVRGTVKQLLVNTVGGVVQPGSELMEIVPLDDTLILETKIRPRDIGFLRPGQPAVVKFSAYDFAIFGGMDGEVQQIAADSVIAEDGTAHYLARVRTFSPELAEGMPIIPGMLAEVDIVTGKKTLLQYLFKPVLRARHTAFTER